MKILICNFEYPPLGGGGGVMTALLAEEMAKKHEITILTSQAFGLPRESSHNGVRVVRVPVYFRRKVDSASLGSMFAYVPMALKKAVGLMRANHYDVINTHFVVPTGPVGDALSRMAGIPNILTLHGGDLYDPTKTTSPHRFAIMRSGIKCYLRRADLVVGQSTDTLERASKLYTPRFRKALVPLAIAKPQFKPISRKDWDFTDSDVLLMTVGRLINRKAIPQLIRMMESFRGTQVHLLIVGIGTFEEDLKAEVAQKKLSDQIHFTGFVDEDLKFSLLQMSDLYVSTTQHEGFGIVFLEAMVSGLPIVCYDKGGQTDFLQDGKTGYLVPLNDLDLFTERCRSLIQNRALRMEMAKYNEQYVQEFFIDEYAQKYENIFREAIHANSKRRISWLIPERAT